MGIGSAIGKIGGFVSGILPTLLKLGEAFDLVLRLVRIGVKSEDVAKLNNACDNMDSLAANLADLGAEIYELSAVLRQSIEDGEISGLEGKEIALEAQDILPELEEIREDVTKTIASIKSAL